MSAIRPDSASAAVLALIRALLDPEARYADGVLVMGRIGTVPLVPPLSVALPPPELVRRTTTDPATRDALWPGRELGEAGVLLFSVHLQGLVDRRHDREAHRAGLDASGRLVLLDDVPRSPSPGRRPRGRLHAPISGTDFPDRAAPPPPTPVGEGDVASG